MNPSLPLALSTIVLRGKNVEERNAEEKGRMVVRTYLDSLLEF
jgi:hypothetical protein